MGADKARLLVNGLPLASRLAGLLAAVCAPVFEVGPGCSGLPAVTERPPGQGPLVAVAAGEAALATTGWSGPAVVLACDMPRLTPAVVALLAEWPGPGAVVPVVAGRRQPLCARWSADDLSEAAERARCGQRSLAGLPGAGPCDLVTEDRWGTVADPDAFSDVDGPEDLRRLGLALRLAPGVEPPAGAPGG